MSNINREENFDNLTTLLRFVLSQWAKSALHTTRPGLIESYDPVTRRARVRAGLRTVLTGEAPGEDGEGMEPAVSVNVPVLWPFGGGVIMHFRLAEGDPVHLVFSERGLSEFKTTYELSTPDKTRFFSEADAVAIVGYGPLEIESALEEGAVIQTYDGKTFIEVSADKVLVQHGNQDVLITSDGLVSAIEGDVSISATGDVTLNAGQVNVGGTGGKKLVTDAFFTLFNSHTHLPGGALNPASRANAGHATSKTRAT